MSSHCQKPAAENYISAPASSILSQLVARVWQQRVPSNERLSRVFVSKYRVPLAQHRRSLSIPSRCFLLESPSPRPFSISLPPLALPAPDHLGFLTQTWTDTRPHTLSESTPRRQEHWLRKRVQEGDLQVEWIPKNSMPTDGA
ncbi:hypothetical protein RJ035_007536 [Blastomyces gilchristii]